MIVKKSSAKQRVKFKGKYFLTNNLNFMNLILYYQNHIDQILTILGTKYKVGVIGNILGRLV